MNRFHWNVLSLERLKIEPNSVIFVVFSFGSGSLARFYI